MAKIDKSQYTKAQWKIVREERRRQKEHARHEKAQKKIKEQKETERTVKVADNDVAPAIISNTNNYIVCLKHGSKYDARYVNHLYNMTKRHCTVPFEFVCFTDDVSGIIPEVKIITLQHLGVYGWWYKPMFFDKNLPIKGNLLYFDLDVVIFKNIDNLFTYSPDSFAICRDFNRSLRHDWNRMNSSVFKMKTGSLSFVYDKFMENAPMNMRRFHGDQDWIYDMLKDRQKDWVFWPDQWIMSYKWEMRDRADLEVINGVRNFKTRKIPTLLPKTNVAVFHGEPHPHQVEDDWVKENWR